MQYQWDDFWQFSKYQIEVGDNHPIYAVLRNYFKLEDLSLEQKIWRCLLYVCFDHIGSAETLWKKYPEPCVIKNPEPMKTSVARRLFRGNTNWCGIVNSIMSKGDIVDWLEPDRLDGKNGWIFARQKFGSLKFNGSWATYKWADTLKNVLGFKITADTIGENSCVLHCASELSGFDIKKILNNRDMHSFMFRTGLNKGVKFSGIDELETCLCDFVSFVQGRYYIGKEIDDQMEQLPNGSQNFWKAREMAFDKKFLGEFNGYFGVRKELLTLYRDKGVIKFWN